MNDRDQSDLPANTEASEPDPGSSPSPVLDMDVFAQLRDVVRTHYMWKWETDAKPTKQVVKMLTQQINHDPQFRLVGDVDVEDDIFQITLWLEHPLAFSLSDVDVLMLDTLEIDLGRCTIIARELTKLGLEYHLITFGEGRAQQFRVNVMGPRMQQIRDLGTLVTTSLDDFSA